MPPSGPSSLSRSLRTRQKEGCEGASAVRVHAAVSKGMGGWVRSQGSRLEPLEGGVALERLGERHAALGAEVVAVEAAHTAKGG